MINIKNELASYHKAIHVCNLILKNGGEVRFIGGIVRDLLLNKEIKDIDLATNLLPSHIQKILIDNKIQYFTIGKEFGTITAVIDKQPIEITTLRKDINCYGRHAEVEFTNDWEEDAKRRDFTVNALSADLDGNIYDYFNGIADIQNKKIRFIGKAEDRIQEDYLRILRFFRFSSYFSNDLDEEGLIYCNKFANKLKNISSERIKSELIKIFEAPNGRSTIKHMEPVFQNIYLLHSPIIEQIDRLYILINQFNYQLKYIMCFAVIVCNSNDTKNIIKNSAFTRAEQKFLSLITQNKIKEFDQDNLEKYWKIYKEKFQEIILINLAISNENLTNNLLTSSLEKLFSQSIKALPIKGEDLLKLGIEKGKDIGKLLIVADQIWYNYKFNITKQELLREILLHAPKL